MTYTFEEIKRTQKLVGKCGKCGKKCQRTLAVMQTVNPFNKTATGLPKTRAQIAGEVGAALAERVRKGLFCAACDPTNWGH